MSRAVGLRSLLHSGNSQRHSVLWFPTNTVVCGSMSSRNASWYSIDLAFVPPRKIGHVRDQRDLGVVGGDLGDGADRLRAADETDLENLHRHVFEDGAGLLGHGLFVEGEMVEYFGRIARIGARDDWQSMGPDRSDCGDVRGQSARAAGVARVEHHHARGVAGVVFVVGGNRGVSFGDWGLS